MTNIVDRLRSDAPEIWEMEWQLRCEAADEIARLNKDGAEMAAIIRQQGFEIERLRRALEDKP